MSLIWKAARHELKAVLLNQTAAQGRVEEVDVEKIFDGATPSLNLWSDGEHVIETVVDFPREYKRTISQHVTAVVQGSEMGAVLDALDDLSDEAFQILSRNDTLNGKAAGCVLKKTTQEVSTVGRKIFAARDQQFEIYCYEHAPAPAGDNLPAFTQAGVEIDAAPAPDGVPEIQAEIPVPQ